jgi:UDP-sugar pyrophosphorylase
MRENASILSKEEKNLVIMLLSEDQHHLFDNWDPPGTRDHDKHLFFETIDRLHKSYNVPGGLSAYLNNAKSLLTNAKLGINPLEGWIPEVPAGVALTPFSADYIKYEENGTSDIFNCGFVLVAGGLGERLGYNGIKVELPVEMTTSTKYLELYCQQLLAMQNRFKLQASMSDADIATKVRDHIPLAIMVSDDTVTRTISLLEENNYFGLEKEQITILKQEKVAALLEGEKMDHLEQTEIQMKYEVYINKEIDLVVRMSQMEDLEIPTIFDYTKVHAISNEAREKLHRIKPRTLGQASRISGINPSDVQILMVYMGR